MPYDPGDDKLIETLATVSDPAVNSEIKVNVRSYRGGPNKIVLERFSETGQRYKLGRLSGEEWQQLCSYIRSGESGAVTGVKLFAGGD